MGFLDAVLGRRKQPKPNLDQLFAVPSAAVTLQVSGGFRPTGIGSVCYRANEGAVFDLVTELHAVNRALEDAGFGGSLLCSLVVFEHDGRRLGLVYLYKQGTF